MMMNLPSILEISLEWSWYTLKSKKGKIHLLYITDEQTPRLPPVIWLVDMCYPSLYASLL